MSVEKYKLAIFENEVVEVEGAFEYLNIADEKLKNRLDYDFFTSSQIFGNLENLNKYDLIIVDIGLSAKSEMDGFTLIKSIEKIIKNPNIIIITGHDISKGYEKEHDIKPYPFIEKPITFKKLREQFHISLTI
jgi:DNA-binding NtrC family response regulator